MNHDGRTSLKSVEDEDVLTNCNTPALLVIWQAHQDHKYESTGRLLPFPGPSSLIKLQLGNWLPMQRISFFCEVWSKPSGNEGFFSSEQSCFLLQRLWVLHDHSFHASQSSPAICAQIAQDHLVVWSLPTHEVSHRDF
jgi:hypothetical protein